jgi:hypothetical protein
LFLFATAATFGTVAVLHFIDPSHVASLGLPAWMAYVIGTVELLSVIGLFAFADSNWIEVGLTSITLGAIGLYLKTSQYELIALPGLALGLLIGLRWANRPGPACACALRHHPTNNSDTSQ